MKTAVLYICNAGYLVPGLVSAIAARRLTSAHLADVLLFDIGPPSRESEVVEDVAQAHGILYTRLDPDFLEGMHIVYARLMIDRFLPATYGSFIYVDGDTQVWDSLDELASASVADGSVLASHDPMAILLAATGKARQPSPCSTAISSELQRRYVNAGVFKAERRAWTRISAEALALSRSGQIFDFRDQDVINITAREKIKIMSLKWNFPACYLRTRLETLVKPRLVHFMSNPRPWHGSFFPWGKAGRKPYQRLIESHPELSPYHPKLGAPRYAKYLAQQQYSRMLIAPAFSKAPFFNALKEMETNLAV